MTSWFIGQCTTIEPPQLDWASDFLENIIGVKMLIFFVNQLYAFFGGLNQQKIRIFGVPQNFN